MQRFAQALDTFLQSLPKRPVFLDNVYDPTFGNDRLDSLDIEPSLQGASEIRRCFLHQVLPYMRH